MDEEAARRSKSLLQSSEPGLPAHTNSMGMAAAAAAGWRQSESREGLGEANGGREDSVSASRGTGAEARRCDTSGVGSKVSHKGYPDPRGWRGGPVEETQVGDEGWGGGAEGAEDWWDVDVDEVDALGPLDDEDDYAR